MTRPTLIAAIVAVALTAPRAHAQDVIVDLSGSSRSFDFQGAMPISPTTVIQMYFTRADSGATLAYALVVRGPTGWYNAKTHVERLPKERVAPRGVGEHWQVGARGYDVLFDPGAVTLSVFDSTVSLAASKTVLVTLPDDVGGKVRIESGAATDLFITRADRQPIVAFLRKAVDVQAFAGVAPKP